MDFDATARIKITVLQATNLINADYLSKSDPYVRIYYNGKKIGQTRVVIDDLNPQWQSFNEFLIEDNAPNRSHAKIRIECRDSDLGKDDMLGLYQVSLKQLPKGCYDCEIPMYGQGMLIVNFDVQGDGCIVGRWEKDVVEGFVPHSLVGCAAFYYEAERRFYFHGGGVKRNDIEDNLWYYDVEGCSWHEYVVQGERKRMEHSATVLVDGEGDAHFIITGGDNRHGTTNNVSGFKLNDPVFQDYNVIGVTRPRKRAGCVTYDNKFYVWGGLKKNADTQKQSEFTSGCDVFYFEGTELIVKTIMETPPMFYHQILVDPLRNSLLSICGLDPTPTDVPFIAQTDIISFNLDTNQIKYGDPSDDNPDRELFPDSRCGHTCLFSNNLIYIFGGFSESSDRFRYYKEMEILDLNDPHYRTVYSAKELGEKPPPIELHYGSFVDNTMYIFGGTISGEPQIDIYKYSPFESATAKTDPALGIIFNETK